MELLTLTFSVVNEKSLEVALVKLDMAGGEGEAVAGDGLQAVSGHEDPFVLGVSEDVVTIVGRMMEKFGDGGNSVVTKGEL